MLILTQDRFTTVNLDNIIKIYVKCGNTDDGENDNKIFIYARDVYGGLTLLGSYDKYELKEPDIDHKLVKALHIVNTMIEYADKNDVIEMPLELNHCKEYENICRINGLIC